MPVYKVTTRNSVQQVNADRMDVKSGVLVFYNSYPNNPIKMYPKGNWQMVEED